IPDSRDHPETLSLGKAVAVFYRDRDLPDAGVDRACHSGRRHLSRGRRRSTAADRGAVDGPDDRGRAVGIVGSGARHGDAGEARNEAARLFIPTTVRQELKRRPRRWTAPAPDAIPRTM